MKKGGRRPGTMRTRGGRGGETRVREAAASATAEATQVLHVHALSVGRCPAREDCQHGKPRGRQRGGRATRHRWPSPVYPLAPLHESRQAQPPLRTSKPPQGGKGGGKTRGRRRQAEEKEGGRGKGMEGCKEFWSGSVCVCVLHEDLPSRSVR